MALYPNTYAPIAPARTRRRRTAAAAPGRTPSSLVTWYLGLTPYWMGADSPTKTRILLRAHEWIIDRVLAPGVGLAGAAADLRSEGPLTRALGEVAGPDDRGEWRHFVQLVVANLRHALLLPVTVRNEAWARWLFLIPYSIRQTAEASPAEPRPAAPMVGEPSQRRGERIRKWVRAERGSAEKPTCCAV
jgi:hypothetical protein